MSAEGDQRPPQAPMGGRLAWWPFLVALIGVAVVVVVIVLVGSGTTGSRQQGTGLTSSGAVACPRFYEDAERTAPSSSPWVPAKPAGLHTPGKMVPKLHPTHVTVCAYLGKAGRKSLRLSGQRELTGKLDRVVDTLRPLPAATGKAPACAAHVNSTDGNRYLIGLRYDEAIVWVSAPADHCAGAGNGVFRTYRNISSYAVASYAARTWVSSAH